MNEYDIRVGSVVLSTQGRDKGMYFLVVSVGKGFVFLADGGMRKLNAPKKKNVKHVGLTNTVLDSGSMSTNRSLRRALNAYSGVAQD